MQTTIFVRNLVLCGIHGSRSIQTNTKRTFTLHIEVQVSGITRAVQTDTLSDAFDYQYIISCAKEVIYGSSVQLIETLAERIAAKILAHPLAKKITLTLTKGERLDRCESGITITRSVPVAFRA